MAANSREDSNVSEFPQLKTEESFPVVFQCNDCNNILTDSCAWVASDRDLEVICVNKVTSFIHAEGCLETSTQGADIGSTFMPIQCKSCGSPIGRIYRTTPKELDHLRNLYCLDLEHIRSYQVGSMDGIQTLPAEEVLDLPTAKALQQGIHKIESVIIMLLERLTILEEGINNNNPNKEDHDSNLTKTVHNGMNYEVPVKDTQEEKDMKKPNKKKRK